MLQPQLAARGGDVGAFFGPERGGNASRLERMLEHFATLTVGPLPRHPFHRIVRNQIYFCVQPPRNRSQFVSLVEHIIDVFNEDVLKGQHAFLGIDVVITSFQQFA